jgi:flagella basal body P-ring formation protein FlgA
MTTRPLLHPFVASLLAAVLAPSPAGLAATDDVAPASRSAVEVVRAAIVERLGDVNPEVTIVSIDLPVHAPTVFRDAQPDPAARLGRPMRFVLRPMTGRPVIGVVEAEVVVDRAVAGRDIARGETLTAADVRISRARLADVPLRRLPAAAEIDGGRALRPLAAGDLFGRGYVRLRRAVEPGDTVTVVAVAGDIEVTAQLVAADGGHPGDIVRIVNPETRRDLRARVIERGRVEVHHAR